MELDFFNKSNDATKDENGIQNFFESVKDFFKDKFQEDKPKVMERREISLIQELETQGKVTTSYRDKMLIERSKILNTYAKEILNEAQIVFISL